MSTSRKRDLVIAAVLSLPFLLCCGYAALFQVIPEDWAFRTPTALLPDERVQYLCESLRVGEEEDLCNPPEALYLNEFFPVMEEVLSSDEGRAFSRVEIQQVLGEFEVRCEETNASTRCWYELTDDSRFLVLIQFSDVGDIDSVRLLNDAGF